MNNKALLIKDPIFVTKIFNDVINSNLNIYKVTNDYEYNISIRFRELYFGDFYFAKNKRDLPFLMPINYTKIEKDIDILNKAFIRGLDNIHLNTFIELNLNMDKSF